MIFSAQQDEETSQELTVIEEESIDDHFSEFDMQKRPESRLGSTQSDIKEISFGKQEERIREQFKEHWSERNEAIELQAEIKDIPILEKLMMMHRAEQNRTIVPNEQFEAERLESMNVRQSSSCPITDEDLLTEIIAQHSDNHSSKKSHDSAEKGDCGAPIISDTDSVASNISDDNVLTIASGNESDENEVQDEIQVINGVTSHGVETKVEVRAERSQFEVIRLCSFADLLGEYNWSIPYALYKVW